MRALACTTLHRRPIAVSAGWDSTIRIWDLMDRTQIGDALIGHRGDPLIEEMNAVQALTCTALDRRPVAVSGGWDGNVRVWDLTDQRPISQFQTGNYPVSALACTSLHGRPVAVVGSYDRTVQVWDLAAGSTVGGPLTLPSAALALSAAFTHRPWNILVGFGSEVAAFHWIQTSWDGRRRSIRSPLAFHEQSVGAPLNCDPPESSGPSFDQPRSRRLRRSQSADNFTVGWRVR